MLDRKRGSSLLTLVGHLQDSVDSEMGTLNVRAK